MSHPLIIQGGMGAGVSKWRLARSVSICGQMGVVSGTALDVILARRLQEGDSDGDLRRALSQFPIPGMAQRTLDRYFIPGGKRSSQPYKAVPLPALQPGPALIELNVIANFVEVFLAKEGHAGLVGINYLEKIQLPTLPSLFGAMLAGVDYVLMGAGIPMAIPGILDQLSRGEAVRLRIDVEDAESGEEFFCTFDPAAFCGATPPALSRHHCLPRSRTGARAQGVGTGGRLRRRRSHRRRTQCPAAWLVTNERTWQAGLWFARRAGS
jgi:nitronate monooxygenase